MADEKPPPALPDASRTEEAAPVAAATETAQNEGPQSQAPPLPSVPYDRDPRLLQYRPPPAPLPKDRTLVHFFRFLASLLFWGGSAAGLSVIFFRLVVLPRLAVLSTRLTALHSHHLGHYSKFATSVRQLAISNSLLCPKTSSLAAAVETPLPSDNTRDEAVQAGGPEREEKLVNILDDAPAEVSTAETSMQLEEKPVEGAAPADAANQTTGLPTSEGADITAPLRASLAALQEEVAASTRSDEEQGASSTKKLVDSLEMLSSYISTQSFYATQHKLNLGGGGYSFGQVPAPNGMQIQNSPAGEAAAQCRSEVRGLKGLLLNRRNFALLDRLDDDDELPTITA